MKMNPASKSEHIQNVARALTEKVCANLIESKKMNRFASTNMPKPPPTRPSTSCDLGLPSYFTAIQIKSRRKTGSVREAKP